MRKPRARSESLTLALLLASTDGCAGGGSAPDRETAPSVRPDLTAPEPSSSTTRTSEAAPATSAAIDAAGGPAEPTSEAPWPVELASSEGVWAMAALAPSAADEGAVALYTHAALRQRGYDPMATAYFVEVRDRAFHLRWRRVERGPVIDLAASPDGSRILVLDVESTRVLAASDGHELLTLPGRGLAGTIDAEGRILRALRPSEASVVEIAAADGTIVRSIDVPGAAPSTIHAMMTSGECHTIFTQSAVHVTALASGHGVIAIGASDGSIRIHRDDPSVAEARLERRDARRHPGHAVSAVALWARGPHELVAVYSDGQIVRWDPLRGARAGRDVAGACTAAELARIAVIPGLPGDVEECGAAMHAALAGEHVALSGSAGLRVRTLAGDALAGMPSLHAVGPVILGDELWAGGTDAMVERWSLDGRFRGTHRVGTGWANVVAISPELVAVMGAGEGEIHGRESEGVRPTAIWRIADGTRLGGFDDVRGAVRFAGEHVVATLADGRVVVRRTSDARELVSVSASASRDAGLPEARVAIARAAEGTVIVGDRVHLVTADAIRELGPAPPRPDAGVVTELAASRDGRVLARLVFDASSFSFALEIFSLGPTPTLLSRRERVGEHLDVRADGAEVIVSSRGEEVAHRLAVPSGSELPLPIEGASWVGYDASGRACVHGRDLDATLACVEGERLVPAGPRLLSMTGADALGERWVAFSLGSGAYVLDDRGRTLAHVGGVGGDGFAITGPEGLFAASAGQHDELFVRSGDRALPLEASEVPRDLVAGAAQWRATLGAHRSRADRVGPR